MTSSLLSLQPFVKMKIISFSLESRPNLYLPLYCLAQYHPLKSILSFSNCACLGQMKHLEGTQARGQNFYDTWILSRGIFPWIHCKPHRVCATQKDMVFALFRSKNGYTLCSFWFGIGYGFRGKNAVKERICRFNSKLMNKKEKEIFAYSLT